MENYINNMSDAQFDELQELWEDEFGIPPAESREEFLDMVLNQSEWPAKQKLGWTPEKYCFNPD